MNQVETTLLQSLIQQQKQYIDYFFQHLELSQVEKVVEKLLECNGLIVLTGIGKSGIVAEKIAVTLISTGTRALHLSTTNFLHGDIGAIGKDDVVILLSKSGETEELIALLPHIRKKGSTIIAVISEENSRLARGANMHVCLPVEKELCPFDLAPTTSTAVQLLFGDMLAMALMQEKGFSIEEYADNHPSGAIGKKITLCVRDLMQTDLPICGPKDLLVDVIVKLSNKRCGCLLVIDGDSHLLGIFTDGDLRRALEKEGATVLEKSMEELMNPCHIIVAPDDLVHAAMKQMQEGQYVMVAPVIEDNTVIGLIRMHDIIYQGI